MFHYVLDTTRDEFEVRPYYLDAPEAVSVSFIDHNDTTGIQVNTASYAIERVTAGYRITLVTTSNDAFKATDNVDLQVFLSYIPSTETDRAYLESTFVSLTPENERVYEFYLTTDFDVDSDDLLHQTNFLMYDNGAKVFPSALYEKFDILYTTSGAVDAGWLPSETDAMVPWYRTVSGTKAITRESIRVRFGYSLKTLWARSRSVVSAAPFKKYTVDIPMLYEEDQYLRDLTTGATFTVSPTGDLIYTKTHSRGDPVISPSGAPVYKHRIGDVMLDAAGKPILEDTSMIVRQIDMMFIEGAYYFATDAAAATYRQAMVTTVVSWLINDLTKLSETLLEQTRLYYYPKTNMGLINVMVENGVKTTIEAGQYFIVDLYVTDIVYRNTALRESLTKTTIKRLDELLKSSQISMSTVVADLRSNYADDVLNVKVKGLGGEKDLSALMILDDGDRCALRKRLVALADGSLIVSEDVTVNFIRHQVSEV